MWRPLQSTWTLFLGMILLMISNGLLSTLLTLRGSALGFPETAIGLMQSAYPAGAFAGCLIAPRLVSTVGHIRTFAALASLASATTLVHLVTEDPWSWGAMRAVSGFCFSGLYVVVESWLNGQATNRNRGTLLSLYFVIQTGGSAAGQAFLSISSPEGVLLLVITSILISVALVPILISASATPPFVEPERISVRALFGLSPMALSGALLNGVAQGAIYVALALYAGAIGLGAAAVGALVAACTLGGMMTQFPLGLLSDRIDRRFVITGAAAGSVLVALGLAALGDTPQELWIVYLGVGLLGGLTLPIYSLCAAHMNDQLRASQIVAASATLVLVLYVGIIAGPTLGAVAVRELGPTGFFLLMAGLQGLTACTAVFRFWKRRDLAAKHGHAVAMTQHATPLVAQLNPDSPNLPEATNSPAENQRP